MCLGARREAVRAETSWEPLEGLLAEGLGLGASGFGFRASGLGFFLGGG